MRPAAVRSGPIHEVVLVGGGHTHIQVLKSWAMAPPPGARLTLVVDRPIAIYSGMVPGLVAGQYARPELEIDVWPLARRAGARAIVARAVGVDADERRIALEGRPPLRYDTASFDVGSTVTGLDLPGVREHAVPTRPIADLVDRVDHLVASLRSRPRPRVIVVGGGAGGVELAFALRARLEREGARDPSVTLLERGPALLPGYPRAATRRAEDTARTRGIAIRCGAVVTSVGPDHVALEGGERLDGDAFVWVAGAASRPLFARSGLPVDARGFVRVRDTLQVVGRDELFAVGDCASLEGHADLPKAGVYAVREGPVLVQNLRARLAGRALRAYRPQRDYLSLLNTGDGRAIGSKWGMAAEGRALFRLKDWIDRRFMRRFQVLGPDDAATPEFQAPSAMGPGAEMLCGGCAAKVGESVLSRALERIGAPVDPAVLVGLAERDDVAAVASERGEVLVSTVDSFRAFTDDPYLVGKVAAVNAMSDLWAKGIAPRFALAQISVPEGAPEETEESLFQAMAGARVALDADRVTLVGGHTTTGPELVVGFSVFAFTASAGGLLRIGGLQPGDRLILTKPLGTGVLFQGDMRGLARGEWIEAAIASMARSNAEASHVATLMHASAATDVTGFGLAGHLGQMLRASKASAAIDLARLPLLPGVASLFARGLRSTFHEENARGRRGLFTTAAAGAHPALEALFDPQTSGGLLFGVAAERADEAISRLAAAGETARVIGVATAPRPDGALFEVDASGETPGAPSGLVSSRP
jgi:selenide, water dikinase